ncbi:glycoside hydrolase family 43 protein [Ferruginibacter sp.]|nr:glycoside hydrolase family 43 protein [Ferruginibacter sp.]
MIAKHKILILVFCAVLFASCNNKMYLFTSFHEPANEGLRLLYSKDGYHWKTTDSIYLKPLIGKDKIMRDPSMKQGPDGTFHLVWTTEWKGGNGFGYASSNDLKDWSAQEYIPVMQKETTVVNVWAPELFYDDENEQFIIIWASTIPLRFEKGVEAEDNNHRMYYVTTKDFKIFSDTKLFLDPKFSVIDAVIVKRAAKDYVLVLKDNTRPERNIKVAFANNPLGPWENISNPFTEKFTEGPAVAKVKNGYLIYYDVYQNKKYGASFTKDFKSFTQVDSLITVPAGHKHGTILKVNKRIVQHFKN